MDQETTTAQVEHVTCSRCGAACVPQGCTTGYGEDKQGNKFCFACCADNDRAYMVEHGRWTGYLTHHGGDGWTVSNWPGSLRFRCRAVTMGRHNIARVRRDAWFTGPDGFVWHATQYGDDTQIAHCRRTRKRA